MAEGVRTSGATRLWSMRAGFALIALATILFNLMPLETTPRRWAGPDLLVVLVFAWSVRRPDYAPTALVAVLVFLADLMFQRPPGLFAALVVLASEWLRMRGRTMHELPFVAEWLAAAGAMTAVVLANRAILAIMFTSLPPLSLSLMQLIASIAIYPVVVLFCRTFFGLRKLTHADFDMRGQNP
ncbi:MAG: rod shape-determining protein MreD [Pseudooceanicola sp.]